MKNSLTKRGKLYKIRRADVCCNMIKYLIKIYKKNIDRCSKRVYYQVVNKRLLLRGTRLIYEVFWYLCAKALQQYQNKRLV